MESGYVTDVSLYTLDSCVDTYLSSWKRRDLKTEGIVIHQALIVCLLHSVRAFYLVTNYGFAHYLPFTFKCPRPPNAIQSGNVTSSCLNYIAVQLLEQSSGKKKSRLEEYAVAREVLTVNFPQ